VVVVFPILSENVVKVVFIQNHDMFKTLFTNRSYPVWCKYSITDGPGGIRTRGLISAIEDQVGEKGEKAVHYVYFVPK